MDESIYGQRGSNAEGKRWIKPKQITEEEYELIDKLSARARRSIKKFIAESPKFKTAIEAVDLPKFDCEELRMGQILGKGQFGVVYEVKGIDLKAQHGAGNLHQDHA